MMTSKYILSTFLFYIALFAVCGATRAYGAEVTFAVVPTPTEGDTATTIEVRIDAENVALNAVEGIIAFLGADEITSVVVETGGSLLSLWPITPHYSEEDRAVRFVGGSPAEFLGKGTLFRMRIFSEKSDDLTLSWVGGAAYRNDGMGTAEPITARSLTIALSSGEPDIINPASFDTKPPYFDAVYVTKDTDVYDGKYFVSFHASDDVSGISHYDVVENQITTRVESNGLYVLQDQERTSKVVVIAYDQAGNSTSLKVPTRYAWVQNAIFIGVLLLIIIITMFLIFRKKKRNVYGRR